MWRMAEKVAEEDTSSKMWQSQRQEKRESGELELFLGQGRVTIGNEAG